MVDASPHAVIQSFVTGLADFLNTLHTGDASPLDSPGQCIAFTWVSSADPTLYIPPQDLIMVGFYSNGGVMLSTSSANTFSNISTTKSGPRADVLYINNAGANISDLRIPLKTGQRYYLVSNGGACAVMVVVPAR